MKKYKLYEEMPPDINYEELAKQAGYSDEEIEEMFGPSIELIFYPKNTDTEPVEVEELNLATPLPLEDIPF